MRISTIAANIYCILSISMLIACALLLIAWVIVSQIHIG